MRDTIIFFVIFLFLLLPMKITRRINPDRSGSVIFRAEHVEDFWMIYNLLFSGDLLTSHSFRKVQTESATSTQVSKRKVLITLRVTAIDYTPGDPIMRVSGRNIRENEFVRLGAFHTIELNLNRSFTITKTEWTSVDRERMREALDPHRSANIAAICIREGIAQFCLIGPSQTSLLSKVELSIPRKRKGSEGHDKSLIKFFDKIVETFLRTFNFDVIECILVISNTFLNTQWVQYLEQVSSKKVIPQFSRLRSKMIIYQNSSGHMGALDEILADPRIRGQLENSKVSSQANLIELFYQTMEKEPDRVAYGWNHVEYASQQKAIDILMVSEKRLRSPSILERRKYISLLDDIKRAGSRHQIFTGLSQSGEQLDQLTGVAAILRFPLPEIEEIEQAEDTVDFPSDQSQENGFEDDQARLRDILSGLDDNDEEEDISNDEDN